MLTIFKQSKFLTLGVIILSSLWVVVFSSSASALSGSQFRADRIIDDAIFYNGNALTANQIQTFLNAKMPSCDTNGQKMYNSSQTRAQWAEANGRPLPPYTCLKDFRQDYEGKSDSGLCNAISSNTNRTAAQIIDDVSRACSVSQKALIVMLQKEQSLITDDWPWPVQYQKAMGYYCPDDPNNPGWCHPEYAGFFNQVYNAAKQLNRYKLYPQDFNHAAGRTSYVAYQANAPHCGGTNLYMRNAATAALYNYTPYQPNSAALNNLYGTGDACSAYGNRNFWRMFNDWFGSTHLAANECDSKVSGVTCVWSLMKTDGSQFLTASKTERDLTINNYGWIYEGVAFYVPQSQRQGTVPTYRLRQNNQTFYTANQTEYDTMRNSGNWIDEGIAFYAYPSTASTNASHKVYKLYNSSLNRRYWTIDENRKTALINQGYVLETSTFNSFSGLANLALPAVGRVNIYRSQGLNGYFYTSSLRELENVLNMGFIYEGVITSANASNSGTPVYRLQSNGRHFYTTNLVERNNAIQQYGMTNEGIGFYLDGNSAQIYRVANTISNKYLYTTSLNEVMLVANLNGWTYEGVLLGNNLNYSPIYRFLNLFNNRHFYTIDINEATRIANKGWKYETVAFHANKSSGHPVYRLLKKDKHFYTTNANERDIAVNKFGYVYEGIGYYVSSTTTSKPVYRLQGGSGDEYFYTAHEPEKDVAASKFGYSYEGIGFYLPTGN